VKLLTLARDLRRRKARERQGLFVAEGVRAVEELLASDLVVRGVLVAPHLDATPRGAALHATLLDRALPLIEVSDDELASAADTDTPQGVLAVAEQPAHTLDAVLGDQGGELRLLALDALQDPGNAGTLLRTAAALGVAATVALPGTVDLWSAKVVRSAMGAHFRHPALSSTWDTLGAFLGRRAIPLWAADAAGEPLDAAASAAELGQLAVVVGNEGGGLTAAARERASRLVSIPITDAVESLNAAVAGAIILYAVRPGSLRR
jgi:RNA methyltransferase, TrmH family